MRMTPSCAAHRGNSMSETTTQEVPAQTEAPEQKARKRGRKPKTPEMTDNRFTNPELMQKLLIEDRYTLDVAGHPLAPAAQMIPRFITKDMSAGPGAPPGGLGYSWANERVWCNPPFSDIEPWVVKAWNEKSFSRLLVPAWTDRKWWHQWVEPYRDRPGSRLTTQFLTRQLFGDPEMPVRLKGQPDFWPVLLKFEAIP